MVAHHGPRRDGGLSGEFGTRLDSRLIDGLKTRLGLVMFFLYFYSIFIDGHAASLSTTPQYQD